MKLPKSWNDVTINQYYELLDVIDVPLSDEDKALSILSALSGISIESLESDIDVKALTKAINDINFISDATPKGNAKAYFKLKGRHFRFDLILKDSNASSFISLNNFAKDKKSIHKVLAIFCNEMNWFGLKKKRTVNFQNEIAEFLKENMKMNEAFLYRDFFLHSFKALSKATLDYLDKQNRTTLKKMKAIHNQRL